MQQLLLNAQTATAAMVTCTMPASVRPGRQVLRVTNAESGAAAPAADSGDKRCHNMPVSSIVVGDISVGTLSTWWERKADLLQIFALTCCACACIR